MKDQQDSRTTLDPALEREVEAQFKYLKFGCLEITPEDEFKAQLRDSLLLKIPLRVKCGIDPTGFDVHLGHTVPFRKMRQFQDLGHVGVVIIGDYTACIGDPTGKSESRTSLSAQDVQQNAKRYMEQMHTILDPGRTEICYQSEWFQSVTLRHIIEWAAQTTVAKLLSHETFKERLDKGLPLALHELFYPVLQGMDSVFVKADVELGGQDQKFNVLMGRDYQRHRGMRPQVAMLLPVITGTCGTQKMSKSLGNYIAIFDGPFDKFGKVMSIPDALMLEYYQYLANVTPEEFEVIRSEIQSGKIHPNEAKKRLAERIVGQFHGGDVAMEMRQKFENVFKKGEAPEDVQEYSYKIQAKLSDILVDSGILPSKTEVRRMAKQGALSIMGSDKLEDGDLPLNASFDQKIIKVGKRKFLKLTLGKD